MGTPIDPKLLTAIGKALKSGNLKKLTELGLSVSQAKSMMRDFAAPVASGGASGASAAFDVGGWLSNKFGSVISTITGGLTKFSGSIGNLVGDSIDNLNGSIDETLGRSVTDFASMLAKSAGKFDIIGAISGTIDKATQVLSVAVTNIYKAEGEARDIVNKRMNVSGELADGFRDSMLEAYVNTKLYGSTFEDIKTITEGISTNLGRVQLLNQSTIKDIFMIQSTLGLDSKTIADAAGAFEDVSIGIGDVSKQIEKSGTYARSIGLKVNDYVGKLTTNMKLLNTYGFKNGVDGLQKMVATASALRMEMGKVTDLADKVMDPEGAIEMAANLNAIGAGFGSLGDPLKMVYQATNDMNGLQDSLVEAAKSLTHYNAESGRFEISATNMRKARDMAKQLGMSAQELSDLGVRAAQRMQAMSEIDMLGKFDDKQKEFLTNVASMKDGKIQIQLPDSVSKKFGDAAKDGFMDVSKLNSEQVTNLKAEMDKYTEATNRKPQELMMEQITELKAIENIAASISTKIGYSANKATVIKDGKTAVRKVVNNAQSAEKITNDGAAAFEGVAKNIGDVFNGNTSAVKMATDAISKLKDLISDQIAKLSPSLMPSSVVTPPAASITPSKQGAATQSVQTGQPSTGPLGAPQAPGTTTSTKATITSVNIPAQPTQASTTNVPVITPTNTTTPVKQGKMDPFTPEPPSNNIPQAQPSVAPSGNNKITTVPEAPKSEKVTSQTNIVIPKEITEQLNNINGLTPTYASTPEVAKTNTVIPKEMPPVRSNAEVAAITKSENKTINQNSTSQVSKSEKKDININLNIKSDQTLYDNLMRAMMNDSGFLSMIKEKIKELNFG